MLLRELSEYLQTAQALQIEKAHKEAIFLNSPGERPVLLEMNPPPFRLLRRRKTLQMCISGDLLPVSMPGPAALKQTDLKTLEDKIHALTNSLESERRDTIYFMGVVVSLPLVLLILAPAFAWAGRGFEPHFYEGHPG